MINRGNGPWYKFYDSIESYTLGKLCSSAMLSISDSVYSLRGTPVQWEALQRRLKDDADTDAIIAAGGTPYA